MRSIKIQRREKDWLRKEKSRNKAQDVHTSSPSLQKSPWSNSHKSCLNQAINRIKKSLPASPRKRNTVVRKLQEEFIPAVSNKSLASKIHLGSLPTSTIELVNNFYIKEDISQMAPGKRDITIRDKKGNQNMQKRHLYMSVKGAYSLFKQVKISLSKFAMLWRPQCCSWYSSVHFWVLWLLFNRSSKSLMLVWKPSTLCQTVIWKDVNGRSWLSSRP